MVFGLGKQPEATTEQPHQYVLSFHLFPLRFLKPENSVPGAARVSMVLIFPDHGSYHTQNPDLVVRA